MRGKATFHKMVDGVEVKQCNSCQLWLSLSHYSECDSAKDGLQWTCKLCQSVYNAAQYIPRQRANLRPEHQIVDGIELKQCSKCEEWKALSEFYSDKKSRDGFQVDCKECRKAKNLSEYHRTKTLHPREHPVNWKGHKTVDGKELKHCGKCDAWKPLNVFHNDRTAWDRLSAHCKKCIAEYAKSRYVPAESPHGPRIPHRFAEDETELKRCSQCQQWLPLGSFTKDKRRVDGLRGYCRACRTKNQLKHTHARRMRQRGIEGSHTEQEWSVLCESFGNKCVRCGEEMALERDHVIPLTKGGSDYIGNIQPLCKTCNSKKGAKLGWDFRPIMVPYEELESMWEATSLPYEQMKVAARQLGE